MRAPVLLTLVSSLAFAQLSYGIDLTQGTSPVLEPTAQTDWRWAPFAVGPANKVDFSVPVADRVTIGRCGCFLTVLGMSSQYMLRAVVPWFQHTQLASPYFVSFQKVLSYSPKYLDDYFNFGPAENWTTGWGFHPDSGGRTCGTVAHPWAASGLGQDVVTQKPFGVTWKEYGNSPEGFARVDDALRQGRPTLVNRVGSSGGRHFNIIVGWDTRTQRYLIWDPMWGREGTAQLAGTNFYAGATEEERYQKWKEAIVTLMPLRITSPHFLLYFQDDPEPIELGVIDPSGRRTGFDPAKQRAVQENLNAWYSVDESFVDPLGLIAPAPLIRTLTVDEPERGTYGLEVFGTGAGNFTVRVGAAEGGPWTPAATLTGVVTQGAVKRFEVHLAETGVVTVEEVPAFFPRARAGNGVVAFVSDTVAFDGRGSYEIGGTITSFAWTFGDGASATGAQVTHAYASPGTYTAQLTVQNAAGLSAVAERKVLVISPVPGETVRASVDANGAEGVGGGSVYPDITPDGRFVAFESYANNLVPNDTNNSPDIFVKDLTTGAIERVSVTSTGAQAQANAATYGSMYPSISADGRYVAFHSDAPNLAADALGTDSVYVHDRVTGATEAVSRGNDGVLHKGRFPSISGDGRFVAFESTDSVDGVAPVASRPNVFVRDRQANTVTWASRTLTGNSPDTFYFGSLRPKMSADGRYVVFDSDARNLVANDPNGYSRDVFVRDLVSDTLSLVSLNSAGSNVTGHSMGVSISADGRYVAFHSDSASYDAADTNGTYDVFVRDRQQGTTTLVSRNSLGEQADRPSLNAALSPNGRFIAFFSRATNLAPNGANTWQAYVRDLQTGETSRVSVSTAGTPASPDVQFVEEGSWAPRPANEGTVAFLSTATNLVPNDTNQQSDIFVRKSTSSPTTTTPLANLGGPYVGWASSAAVSAAIRFDASGSRDPKARALTATWDFGDGTPAATGPLVTTHAFTAPGRYTVKVRVAAGTDVSTDAETQVEVLDSPPAEQLSVFPCASPGDSLVVKGASPAAHAALVASGWDRSTGPMTSADVTLTLPWTQQTVPTELPGFTFATSITLPANLAAGTHTLSVAGGASASFTVPCPAVVNHAPSAHAGGPVYTTTVGTQVTLDGSASSDVEGSSLTYAWDFGDGEKGTGATPTHVYAAAGDFFVTLVVNDGTFDSPTTAGTHSFALVAVTDTSDGGVADGGVQDGGVVLDAPPDMPAASTSGCGCTTSDVTLALWLAAGWLLSTRRRR